MSNVIRTMLNIECAVLMGANIASEVAKEDFCEATIGKFEMVPMAHVKQCAGFCEYLNLSSTTPKFINHPATKTFLSSTSSALL